MTQREDGLLDHLSADPYAIVCESQQSVEDIVDEAKALAKADDVLIAVKEGRKIEERLLPAYLNAYLRNVQGAMHSSSISLETILFLAGDMNISNAIAKVGADKSRFIIFSSRRDLVEKLTKNCKLKMVKELKLILDEKVASEVAMTAIKDYK